MLGKDVTHDAVTARRLGPGLRQGVTRFWMGSRPARGVTRFCGGTSRSKGVTRFCSLAPKGVTRFWSGTACRVPRARCHTILDWLSERLLRKVSHDLGAAPCVNETQVVEITRAGRANRVTPPGAHRSCESCDTFGWVASASVADDDPPGAGARPRRQRPARHAAHVPRAAGAALASEGSRVPPDAARGAAALPRRWSR